MAISLNFDIFAFVQCSPYILYFVHARYDPEDPLLNNSLQLLWKFELVAAMIDQDVQYLEGTAVFAEKQHV